MRNYLDLMALVLTRGTRRDDRTNTGTLSLFGPQMEFDLSAGFPLMTTKRLHWKSIVHELLWFLSGDTNVRYLKENGVSIWNEWADADGELGPVYGHQWRNWARFERVGEGSDHYRKVSIDQIERLVHGLKNAPESRRHLVSAWNVSDVEDMALPPCHALWQCYVADGKLSMKLYQRSADVFLGVPFNIASYALLTHMLAQQCDLEVGRFIWSGGDTHIYLNHLAQAHQQLKRVPKQLPRLRILRKPDDIFSYRFEDFVVEGYDADPNIPAPVAV